MYPAKMTKRYLLFFLAPHRTSYLFCRSTDLHVVRLHNCRSRCFRMYWWIFHIQVYGPTIIGGPLLLALFLSQFGIKHHTHLTYTSCMFIATHTIHHGRITCISHARTLSYELIYGLGRVVSGLEMKVIQATCEDFTTLFESHFRIHDSASTVCVRFVEEI